MIRFRIPRESRLGRVLYLARCERPTEFDIRFRRRIDVNRARNTDPSFFSRLLTVHASNRDCVSNVTTFLASMEP